MRGVISVTGVCAVVITLVLAMCVFWLMQWAKPADDKWVGFGFVATFWSLLLTISTILTVVGVGIWVRSLSDNLGLTNRSVEETRDAAVRAAAAAEASERSSDRTLREMRQAARVIPDPSMHWQPAPPSRRPGRVRGWLYDDEVLGGLRHMRLVSRIGTRLTVELDAEGAVLSALVLPRGSQRSFELLGQQRQEPVRLEVLLSVLA